MVVDKVADEVRQGGPKDVKDEVKQARMAQIRPRTRVGGPGLACDLEVGAQLAPRRLVKK